jgi:hypothetical protein
MGDLVNPYLGTHFPLDADTVQWTTGHVTLLPRLNCNHGRYRGVNFFLLATRCI